MTTVTTTPTGVKPFEAEPGNATVRILNAQMCRFSAGGDIADIPTPDFSIYCKLSDLTIYGNGNAVSVIME